MVVPPRRLTQLQHTASGSHLKRLVSGAPESVYWVEPVSDPFRRKLGEPGGPHTLFRLENEGLSALPSTPPGEAGVPSAFHLAGKVEPRFDGEPDSGERADTPPLSEGEPPFRAGDCEPPLRFD